MMFNKSLEFTLQDHLDILAEFDNIKSQMTFKAQQLFRVLSTDYAIWLNGSAMRKHEYEKWAKDNPEKHNTPEYVSNVHARLIKRLKPYLGERVLHCPYFSTDRDLDQHIYPYIKDNLPESKPFHAKPAKARMPEQIQGSMPTSDLQRIGEIMSYKTWMELYAQSAMPFRLLELNRNIHYIQYVKPRLRIEQLLSVG